MAKLVNLTPHAIVLRKAEKDTVIPPSGKIARVSSMPGSLKDLGLPVDVATATVYGEIDGLPAPEADTFYIVSGLVLSRAVGRDDVFGPGTGPSDNAIRDAENRIIAVTRLIAAPK